MACLQIELVYLTCISFICSVTGGTGGGEGPIVRAMLLASGFVWRARAS
eukprot:CAMPEP_0119333654 /NCGR_PEP_ID=MMETSP1333-20130426/85674_1 /TAXON_ID=418940 /ORGANISM="Scyphosphaera apsteinii, Strain RCC1455" /LENGTH=48 /DNA_ID= /DNA_START= /DNA_END= /DNA_ORIENTATION=